MKYMILICAMFLAALSISAQAIDSIGCTGALGDIKYSFLDTTEFRAENGTCWVLCDGRNITGSELHLFIGLSTIPDARGRFLRSFDTRTSNRVDEDRSATDAIGEAQQDEFEEHDHVVPNVSPSSQIVLYSGGSSLKIAEPSSSNNSAVTSGGRETRPKNVAAYTYIRIN